MKCFVRERLVKRMKNIKKLKFYPLDKTNWSVFEQLFESKGILNNCWCMVWRMTAKEKKNNTGEFRKTYLKQRVDDGVAVGIIACDKEKAIGWCSIAPKHTHNSGLGGDSKLENIWSLTCFFILPAYRRQGLGYLFIHEAKKYAVENGAHYIEAYPVEKDSPSYRHMGFIEMFEKEGFSHTGKKGKRRNVMLYDLNNERK